VCERICASAVGVGEFRGGEFRAAGRITGEPSNGSYRRGADRDRLAQVFSDLAEGGNIQMPLARQPWGADVGWLTDKFGIYWTVSIDKE